MQEHNVVSDNTSKKGSHCRDVPASISLLTRPSSSLHDRWGAHAGLYRPQPKCFFCLAADVNAVCTMRTSAFPLAWWISHPACSSLWDSKAMNLCLVCLLKRNSSFLVWSAMLEVKCTVTPILPPDLLIWAQSLVLGCHCTHQTQQLFCHTI